jgi:uncharacterized membrane-anchored protein/membrane-associated phospholipid phosphatase
MLAAVVAVPAAADPLIAFCASWGLAVPVLLVIVAIVRDVHRRDAIVEAALGGLATVVLVKLGGLIYAHQRPFAVHHVLPLVAHAADNGFPSDHSAAAGLAVAYLWPRSRLSAYIALAFGVLVGAARVAAQLHWPIDIVAGGAFGLAGGACAFLILQHLATIGREQRAATNRPDGGGCVIMKMSNKVPDVTIFFWLIKILATTVGETAADFLATRLHLGLVATSGIMTAAFAIALFVQMRGTRYLRGVYWTVVVFISVVGTLLSDNLVDNLGVPLQMTTIAFSCILAVVFALWWFSEKTLSVHSITTHKREGFYWAAILFTFALGTSAGDLVAESLQLGYALSAVLFASAIGLTALAYYAFRVNGVVAFWIAYVLTRPLGASMGDLLSQPVKDGGVGLGTTVTSVAFLSTIVAVVLYLNGRQHRLAGAAQL